MKKQKCTRNAVLYDGVLVENMFDIPYVKPNQAGPELTAFMARVCTEVKRILPSLPCGVQILAGNNKSALAVAAATEDIYAARNPLTK